MDDLASAKQSHNAKGKTRYKMKLWSHNTNILLQLFTSLQCCLIYISHLVHTTAASSHRQQLGLCLSDDTLTYKIPSTITKFEQQAFAAAGLTVCNCLPSDIQRITDTTVFKQHVQFLRSPYVIRQTTYIFILSFVLLLSSFFFSMPNLSRCRLDVCHTSTHGVALV